MAHPARRWRWIRDLGIAACAVLGALYLFSVFWTASWFLSVGPYVSAGFGSVAVGYIDPHDPEFVAEMRGPDLQERDSPFEWWFRFGYESTSYTTRAGAAAPLWALLLGTALTTVYAWRRRRRLQTGHCMTCGYDLAGNVSAVCPECGNTATESDRQPGLGRRRMAWNPTPLLVAAGAIALFSTGMWFYPSIPGTYRRDKHGNAHGTGRATYRYRSGAVILVEDFRRGKLIRSEWFRPDGASVLVTEWNDESGAQIYLREDGTISQRLTCVRRIANGRSVFYAPDGSVLGEAVFENGERVSGYGVTVDEKPP